MSRRLAEALLIGALLVFILAAIVGCATKAPVYACAPALHRPTQQQVLLCHPVHDDR